MTVNVQRILAGLYERLKQVEEAIASIEALAQRRRTPPKAEPGKRGRPRKYGPKTEPPASGDTEKS
jgi:hypothetical protein